MCNRGRYVLVVGVLDEAPVVVTPQQHLVNRPLFLIRLMLQIGFDAQLSMEPECLDREHVFRFDRELRHRHLGVQPVLRHADSTPSYLGMNPSVGNVSFTYSPSMIALCTRWSMPGMLAASTMDFIVSGLSNVGLSSTTLSHSFDVPSTRALCVMPEGGAVCWGSSHDVRIIASTTHEIKPIRCIHRVYMTYDLPTQRVNSAIHMKITAKGSSIQRNHHGISRMKSIMSTASTHRTTQAMRTTPTSAGWA